MWLQAPRYCNRKRRVKDAALWKWRSDAPVGPRRELTPGYQRLCQKDNSRISNFARFENRISPLGLRITPNSGKRNWLRRIAGPACLSAGRPMSETLFRDRGEN